MSVFTKDLTLFSSIQGIVILNGEGVKEIEVTRRIEWQDETYTESTFTNSEGRFIFNIITQETFFWRFSPQDPSIKQRVEILHEGKRRKAWEYQKKNYDLCSDSNLQPLTLYCDLDAIK